MSEKNSTYLNETKEKDFPQKPINELNKQNTNYHGKEVDSIIHELNTNKEKGLKKEQVDKLIDKFGTNHIETTKKQSLWKLFFSQINQPLIYILIGASIITFF